MFAYRALAKIKVTYNLADILAKILLIDALRKLNDYYKELSAKSLDKKGKPKGFLSKIYDRRLSRISYETSEVLDSLINDFPKGLPKAQGNQVRKIINKLLIFRMPNVIALKKNWDKKLFCVKLLFEHASSKKRLKLLLGDVLYRPLINYVQSDQEIEDSAILIAKVKKLSTDKDVIGLCSIVLKTINKIDVRVIDNIRKSALLTEDAGEYLSNELEGNKTKRVNKKSAITPKTHPNYFTREKPYKLLWKPIPEGAEDLEFNKPVKSPKTGKWSWYAKWVDPNSNNEVTTYLQQHFEENKKENFNTVRKFSKGINNIRAKLKKNLNSSNELDKRLALMVYLIDTGYFRIGNKLSEKEDVRGLAYLQVRHIKEIKGKYVTFSYIAKKQMEDTITVKLSSRTMPIFKSLIKGKEKFDYIFTDENGNTIGEGAVNRFLKNNLGGKKYGASIHKFRHIATTKMFEDDIVNSTPPGFERWKIEDRISWYKERLEKIRESIRHDSITTTLNSYIDPKIVSDFDKKYGFEGLSMTAANPLTGIKKFVLQIEKEKGFVDSKDIKEARLMAEKAKEGKILKPKGTPKKKKIKIKKTIKPETVVKKSKKPKSKKKKIKIKLKKPTKTTVKRIKIAKNKSEVSEKIKGKKRAVVKFKRGGKLRKHDVYFFNEKDLDELEAELNKIEAFIQKFATPVKKRKKVITKKKIEKKVTASEENPFDAPLTKAQIKIMEIQRRAKENAEKEFNERKRLEELADKADEAIENDPLHEEVDWDLMAEEVRKKEEPYRKLWDALDKAREIEDARDAANARKLDYSEIENADTSHCEDEIDELVYILSLKPKVISETQEENGDDEEPLQKVEAKYEGTDLSEYETEPINEDLNNLLFDLPKAEGKLYYLKTLKTDSAKEAFKLREAKKLIFEAKKNSSQIDVAVKNLTNIITSYKPDKHSRESYKSLLNTYMDKLVTESGKLDDVREDLVKYAATAARKIKIKKKDKGTKKKPKIKIVPKKTKTKLNITEDILKDIITRIPSTHIEKLSKPVKLAKRELDTAKKIRIKYNKTNDSLKAKRKIVKPKLKTPHRLLEKADKKLAVKISKKIEKSLKDKAKKSSIGVKETIIEMKASLKKYNTLVPALISDYSSFFCPHNINNDLAVKIKWEPFEESAYAGEFLLYLDKSNWLKAKFHKSKSKWFIVEDQVFGIPDKMIRSSQFSDPLMMNVIRKLIEVIKEELGELEEELPALKALSKELRTFQPEINEKENKLFISNMSMKPIVQVLETKKWNRMHVPERTYIGLRQNKTRLLMQKGNLYITIVEKGTIFPNTEIFLSIA